MVPNHVFLEIESRRRIEEFHREAEQNRLARLAQGERRPWMRVDLTRYLAQFKCRALDLIGGLGFAVERCLMPPARPAREHR
jgi:hypothetical protein